MTTPEELMALDWRSRQEPANYTLRPRRDLVGESIARVNAKIAACFDAQRIVAARNALAEKG